MKIPYRAVFQNCFWFAVSCMLYRFGCWLISRPPITTREIFILGFGYFWGTIGLRHLLNKQADWDGQNGQERGQ